MAETQKYTPLGHGIWRWWKKWRLDDDASAKLLWLFFYTSREAKCSVPGLWSGDVYAMTGSGLSPNDAHNTLARLMAKGMAQYDQENELVRLTELPDTLDRAHTDQAIWGWWGRFRTLPAVPLRDIHVPLLWSLVTSGRVNAKMEETWKKTFATIREPSSKPSLLPLSSSDTSTLVQPSLFPLLNSAPNEINDSGPTLVGQDLRSGSGSGFPEADEEIPIMSAGEQRARDLREAASAAGIAHLLPREA